MAELISFPLDDGGSVTVEVAETPGLSRAARPGQILPSAETLEKALDQVRDAAAAALGKLQSMPRRPDELELTFGIKLDVKAGAVIARTGAEGHFEVRMRWQPD